MEPKDSKSVFSEDEIVKILFESGRLFNEKKFELSLKLLKPLIEIEEERAILMRCTIFHQSDLLENGEITEKDLDDEQQVLHKTVQKYQHPFGSEFEEYFYGAKFEADYNSKNQVHSFSFFNIQRLKYLEEKVFVVEKENEKLRDENITLSFVPGNPGMIEASIHFSKLSGKPLKRRGSF